MPTDQDYTKTGGSPGIVIGTGMPLQESITPMPGDPATAASATHQHPAVSSRQRKTTDANGVVSFTYSRTFDTKPCVIPQAVNDTGRSIDYQVVDTYGTGPNAALIVGCVVTARRGQALPAVLTLLTALINFDVFAGPPAAGVEISLIAILPTVTS